MNIFTNISRIASYTYSVFACFVIYIYMGILDVACLACEITHVHPKFIVSLAQKMMKLLVT